MSLVCKWHKLHVHDESTESSWLYCAPKVELQRQCWLNVTFARFKIFFFKREAKRSLSTCLCACMRARVHVYVWRQDDKIWDGLLWRISHFKHFIFNYIMQHTHRERMLSMFFRREWEESNITLFNTFSYCRQKLYSR